MRVVLISLRVIACAAILFSMAAAEVPHTINYQGRLMDSGGSVNWAGYFQGDAKVTVTLREGVGSFEIDHPLDPKYKQLCHSLVESPDAMNVYNGNVILDANQRG